MGMTLAGWVFLVLAWTFIFGLTFWCFRKIFAGDNSYDD